ncbi:MAG: cupredoxin domain-containing protein [Methanoregula sp.]|nr:cupredoxin domain-containing protein [Methanoregula sp.]
MPIRYVHRVISIAFPLVLVALILVAGCASAPPTTAPPTPSYNRATTILIGSASVNPQILTVQKGVPVTWLNMDSGLHIITSDNGVPESFLSGPISLNERYQYTFTIPGTYTYHCADNAVIKGTIIVKP